jgi:hypothetical protein
MSIVTTVDNVRKVGPVRSLKLMAAMVVALGMVAANLLAAASVSASALGCARWGYVHVAGVSLPTGQYCFGINGSGTTVNNTTGSINTPVIYNYEEVVRFYDGYGNNYRTYYQPTHWGASYGSQFWSTGVHGTAQRGSVCGELTSNSVVVVKVCESIF